jgi:hypothetical protein
MSLGFLRPFIIVYIFTPALALLFQQTAAHFLTAALAVVICVHQQLLPLERVEMDIAQQLIKLRSCSHKIDL